MILEMSMMEVNQNRTVVMTQVMKRTHHLEITVGRHDSCQLLKLHAVLLLTLIGC